MPVDKSPYSQGSPPVWEPKSPDWTVSDSRSGSQMISTAREGLERAPDRSPTHPSGAGRRGPPESCYGPGIAPS